MTQNLKIEKVRRNAEVRTAAVRGVVEPLETRILMSLSLPNATDSSLAYDSAENLHAAYFDSTAGQLKYVSETSSGVSSAPMVIADMGADAGHQIALGISPRGVIDVAYDDRTQNKLYFAELSGDSWQTSVISTGPGTGENPSVSYLKDATPVVSYFNAKQQRIYVSERIKSVWHARAIAGSTAAYSSLAINPVTAQPSLVYQNNVGRIYLAAVGKNSIGGAKLLDHSRKQSSEVSLQFSAAGLPAVGFLDQTPGTIEIVRTLPKNKLTTATAAKVPAGISTSIDLLFTASGIVPAVLYYDSSLHSVLEASLSGTTYSTHSVAYGVASLVGTAVQPGTGSIVFAAVPDVGGNAAAISQTGKTPLPPVNVAVIAVGAEQITVSWSDPSNDATAFAISRSTDGIHFAKIASVPEGTTSYADINLSPQTTYYYQVAAIGSDGSSSIGLAGGSSAGSGNVVASARTSLVSQISGNVYLDSSDTGIYTTGNQGISTLLTLTGVDTNGNAIVPITTTSDPVTGSYHFDRLLSGTYSVTVSQPTGYLPDKQGINNSISNIVLTGSVNSTAINFGEIVPQSIGGFVYIDSDNDGTRDAGDIGIPGISLALTGSNDLGHAVSMSTQTGSNGSYSFIGLRPGSYSVVETQSSAYTPGLENPSGQISNLSLGQGYNGGAFNFGESAATQSFGGFVYIDATDTGTRVSSDGGISAAVVSLTGTSNNGTTINDTVSTSSTGYYQFTAILPGHYTVSLQQPSNYLVRENPSGTVTFAASLPSLNSFGELVPSTIGGFVYVDAGGTGIYSNADAGVSGVAVTLTGTDDLGNPVNMSTPTLSNGAFAFGNLRPGNYNIHTIVSSPYLPGVAFGSGLLAVSLTPNDDSEGNSFGEVLPGNIAGHVYVDAGDTGVYQPGDNGLAGIAVSLAGTSNLAAPVNLSTQTLPDGSYSFSGVAPGSYVVSLGSLGSYLHGLDHVNGSVSLGLASGASFNSANFGALAPASISGVVYNDVAGTGVYQQSDPGISGVTLTLTGINDQGQSLHQTVMTGGTGSFSFTSLRPGTYSISRSALNGYTPVENATGTVSPIVLTAGEIDQQGANFGLLPPVNSVPTFISGIVYLDAGNAGSYQAGDAGVANAQLSILGTDHFGNTVSASVTTASDGSFIFNNLQPGSYAIYETPPVGYTRALEHQTGVISGITLASGTPISNENFGTVFSASASGYVYQDINDSAAYQSSDPGVGGVQVSLIGTTQFGGNLHLSQTTAADGSYNFASVAPGTYSISIGALGGGLLAGRQNLNGVISGLVLQAGSAVAGENFGALVPSSLSGKVYSDSGNTGAYETGYVGFPGVTVTLTGTNDLNTAVSYTTTTAQDGSYSFSGLRPGAYSVSRGSIAGYTPGSDHPSGTISPINLTPGQALNSGYDFGLVAPSAISGLVYIDPTDSGSFATGDLGIGGVLVSLAGTTNLGAAVALNTTTHASGAYSFASLVPGIYTVAESLPGTYLHSLDHSNGVITQVIANPGAPVASENFGSLIPSSIGGVVYTDAANSGTYSAGDPTVAGVPISLTGTDDQGREVSGNATTGANGSYLFSNLRPGNYSVSRTLITGYAAGIENPSGVVSGLTLVPNEALNQGTNFGLLGTASISGQVYIDAGDSGSYQPGDAGIAGISLSLSGTGIIGTRQTVTGSDGTYSFSMLPPGAYSVTEILPNTLLHGRENYNGTIGSLSLAPGAALVGENLGTLSPAQISGKVYNDVSGLGSYQQGDPGVAGVVVSLTGTNDLNTGVTLTATTAPDGSYSFGSLRPGVYSLGRGVAAGYSSGTDHPTGSISGINIIEGQIADVGYDFGMVGAASISGRVYVDPTDSGTFQAGDTGIMGVSLALAGTTTLGAPISLTTTTDASGGYSFSPLTPGTYAVTESLPSGYFHNLDHTSGTVTGIVVASGSSVSNKNFGSIVPSSIAGIVYSDTANLGSYQSGDPAIPGVTINLTGTNDQGSVVTGMATTGTNGRYAFSNLRPGTYSVTRSSVTGYTPAENSSGIVSGLDLTPNEALNQGTNFGFVSSGSISGKVYLDAGDSGSYQQGDQGIPAVTVSLSGSSGTVQTTTGSDGSYAFAGLPPGTYTVNETWPNGYLHGKENFSGTISNLSLAPGASLNNENLGAITPASVTGLVYNDVGSTGSYQSSDPVFSGVAISLSGTDDRGNSVSITSNTASNGSYSFNNLRPGTYLISRANIANYTGAADHGSGTIGNLVIIEGETLSQGTNFGEVAANLNQTNYDSENFDNVTAPAIPPGVNTFGTSVTTSTAASHSSPNSLLFGASNGFEFAYNNATAGNSTWSGWFQPTEQGLPTYYDPIIMLRVQSAPTSTSSWANGFAAVLGLGAADGGIRLSATSGGSENVLANVNPTNRTSLFDSGHWYNVSFTAVDPSSLNTALLLMIQRNDGLYLTVSNGVGSWGSTAADLVNVSVPQSTYGYSTGLACYGGYCPSNAGVFWDDVSWSAATAPAPDAAPTGLTATGGSRQITLSWTATPADTLFGYTYNIYRGTATGTETLVYTNIIGTSLVDAGLLDGATYYYKVSSVGTAGVGPASSEQAATTNPLVTGVGAGISGYVYDDLNNDGSYQAGDVGLVGAEVSLAGTTLSSQPVDKIATTDGNGFYSFDGLDAGNYTVSVTVSAGYSGENGNPGSAGGTAGPGTISNIAVGADANSIGNDFGEIYSSSNTQYLLTPSLLTSVRTKAAANTAQWQAFKARLDGALNLVIDDLPDGNYEGSNLEWLSDYALGYQVLKNIDPASADKYADKAVAIMSSALHDTEDGTWGSRRFLTVGDGSTTQFTLPDANINPSTFKVFLPPTYVKTITKGAANGQDAADPYAQPISISNAAGGPANYTQGTDWRINGNFADGTIDWSLGSNNQPATGATYYVTESTASTSGAAVGYTLQGNTVIFNTAPSAGTAIFVEYLHGQAGDPDGGAYQETSDNRGGFNGVFYDNGYDSRYFQHVAAGLDWLWSYPGLSSTLRTNTANMLVRWSQDLDINGYDHGTAESNYGDGEYVSQVAIALALAGRIDPATEAGLKAEVVNWYNDIVIPALSAPTGNGAGTLYGGHWAEGWTYGGGAIGYLMSAGLALSSAGWLNNGPEQVWADQCITDMLSEQPTQSTIYNGGDNYSNPAYLPASITTEPLAAVADDPVLKAYINYAVDDVTSNDGDYLDLLLHDPTATATNWAGQLPDQYIAAGTGVVTARADWSFNSTWWSFECGNPLACDHQPLSAGQISLNRGADELLVLAASAGEDLSQSKSDAGNLVLVDDNGAGTQSVRYNQAYTYGPTGVSMPEYTGNNSYVYASGNYANAYGNYRANPYVTTASLLTRSVFYLKDQDITVVYDRANTTDPTDLKQLQWWFLNTPSVNSDGSWEEGVSHIAGTIVNSAGVPQPAAEFFLTGTDDKGNVVDVQNNAGGVGQFDLTGLEPGNYTIQCPQGFVAQISDQDGSKLFGKEYSNVPLTVVPKSNLQVGYNAARFGELEINATTPTSNVRYVTVLQAVDQSRSSATPSTQIVSADGKLQGSQVGNDVVLFGVNPNVSGNSSYSVTAGAGAILTHYITDLTPGQAFSLSGANQQSALVSAQGVLTFTTTGTGSSQTVSIAMV